MIKERQHAVVALIRSPLQREHVLVLSRTVDGGRFGLPGGKVEEGEQLIEALRRELHEEVGLEHVEAVHIYEAPTRKRYTHVFEVYGYAGIPDSREGEELRWVLLDELLDPAFCAYAEWYRTFFVKMGWMGLE